MTRLEPSLASVDALLGYEAVCCFLTEDERPLGGAAGYVDWRLCGALSRQLKSGFFEGRPGERLLLPSQGQLTADKVFAVGLGRSGAVTALGLEHAVKQAADMLGRAQVASAVLTFPRLALGEAVLKEVLGRAFEADFRGRSALFAPDV